MKSLRTTHRYQEKIRKMVERGELSADPGSLSQVEVRHDHWCGVFRGRFCGCDAEITIVRCEGPPPPEEKP